jgi:dGTPase
VRAGLISVEELLDIRLFRAQHDAAKTQYAELGGRRLVSETVRRMIDHVVTDLITTSAAALRAARPASIDEVRRQPRPLIAFGPTVVEEHQELKHFLRERVYRHFKVLRMTSKARRVVRELFGAFLSDPNLMPAEHRDSARRLAETAATAGAARAVADYVAGMTDRYAILEHRRLFDPAERT